MAELAEKKERPQFRNIHVTQILTYRLPPSGLVSILHRISGALLFLVGFPFILYLFDQSVTSEIAFERFQTVVAHPLSKLVLLGLAWAYLHHFVAGIRYLLIELHIGVDKPGMGTSAVTVLVVSLALTALVALKLFGAF
jgi:succinate dehydrogenase / fumarate reductase, cytochrome b subunit